MRMLLTSLSVFVALAVPAKADRVVTEMTMTANSR